MRVQWRPEREYWRFQFKINGRRFSFSITAKSEKAALVEAHRIHAETVAEMETARRPGKTPLTLNKAALDFWNEKGQFHSDAKKTHTDLMRLVKQMGPATLLDDVTDADVVKLVAWRQAQTPKGKKKGFVAPATVNRSTTEVLKKLFTRAKTVWRYTFPNEPNWKAHMLKEPEGIVRELRGDEEASLDEAMRSDYAPWIGFALATGLRRAETILKWEHVDWPARMIRTKGKGDRDVLTPITDEIASLLEPLKGHHPEYVFTYVAKRTSKRLNIIKGVRYPITYEGGKTEWQRLRKRAGVKEFRFHDLRHTYGSRLIRETGNIVLVCRRSDYDSLSEGVG